MPQQSCLFEQEIQLTKHIKLPYLLHLPLIHPESNGKLPVILFLHGRDQRGEDLELLKIRGIPKLVEEQPDFPFIVISPQCPSYYIWPSVFDGILAILDEVVRTQQADVTRIYLTGLSMGGYAVWDLAMEYPERFAAIAPVCGAGSEERVPLLRNVPVWAFHGSQDDIVPVNEAEAIIHTLQACGGTAKLTLYPDGGHDAWTETYSNVELYNWFLEHKTAT